MVVAKVRCGACGTVVEAGGAGPGEEVPCWGCGGRVRVVGLPPGVVGAGARRGSEDGGWRIEDGGRDPAAALRRGSGERGDDFKHEIPKGEASDNAEHSTLNVERSTEDDSHLRCEADRNVCPTGGRDAPFAEGATGAAHSGLSAVAGDWEDEVGGEPVEAAPEPERTPAVGTGVAGPSAAPARVDWVQYVRCYPARVMAGVAAVAVGGAAAVASHPGFGAYAVIGVGMIVAEVGGVRRRFRKGGVCPAVVVSERPGRVAVVADLRAGVGGRRMAVKVVGQPLGKVRGGRPGVGARVAAVVTRVGPARDGAWRDMEVAVVRCVTRDVMEAERLEGMLGEQDWREAEEWVAKCPAKMRVGVYRLWEGARGERWWERLAKWVWEGVVVVIVVGLVAWPVWVGKGRVERAREEAMRPHVKLIGADGRVVGR